VLKDQLARKVFKDRLAHKVLLALRVFREFKVSQVQLGRLVLLGKLALPALKEILVRLVLLDLKEI
jgi:hypothetical protein